MSKKTSEFNIDSIKKIKQDLQDLGLIKNWEGFAKLIGYDRTYISRIVNGHEPVTDDLKTMIVGKVGHLLHDTTIGPVEPKVNYRAKVDDILSDYEERLLRVEAHLEVFESAIAGLLTKDNSEFLNKVGELRSAVQEVVRRRFEELKLKHG